jgi:hypothetical protein
MRAKEGMPDKRTGLLPSFLVNAMQKIGGAHFERNKRFVK